jgi:transposase InsO family protein
MKAWLEKQDAYTLHRPLRKRFPRNPYTVNNINNIWEIDILDLSSLTKINNNYRYLLQVTDVFSKYLHSVPLRTKTGKEVAAALESTFKDPKYTKPIRRRPVWVRTDKGKEFLDTQFQALLKREGIEFEVCRNPNVKCAVVERVKRTLRDKLHRYFTYKNTCYLDVLPKFIEGYNAGVHSSTCMAAADVRDTDVLTIWNKMRGKATRRRSLRKPKFRVGQHVRISKEMKFAKGDEQNYTRGFQNA